MRLRWTITSQSTIEIVRPNSYQSSVDTHIEGSILIARWRLSPQRGVHGGIVIQIQLINADLGAGCDQGVISLMR